MTIQMLRAWGGVEQGTVQTLAVPGEEDRLIAAGLARAYPYPLDGISDFGARAENFGVSYNASPAVNVRAMNALLARGGLVSLTRQGQYLFGGPGQGGLLIPSNTTLVCSDGVELILADQTFAPLIRNANAFAAPITLSAVVTWVTGVQVRIDYPDINLLYPVGSWFGLLGLPGSNATNRLYQGVWQVQAVGANSITFYLPSQPPSAGNSATGGLVYPAESNMRVIGGMWDGNETGQGGSGYNDGDPRGLIQFFRNSRNIIVEGCSYRKGEAWCYGSNNVRDVTVRDIDCNTFSGLGVVQAHDIVHLAGGHRNVLVERITADCDDNIVGMTLDDIDGSATYPNYYPGDTYDITIRNINGRKCAAALVALWGNINYVHHSTTIDRVTGESAASAVQVNAPYAPTDMLNCNGGTLKISNISGHYNGAVVSIKSEGNWDQIIVDTVRNESPTSASALVAFARTTTTQTIKKVEIKNVIGWVPGSTNNRTGPAIQITDTNIDDLNIEGLNGMRLAANISLVQFNGTVGSVLRATIEKANATAGATGTSFIASCENTNAAALGQLVVRDCNMVATGGAGGVVQQTASGRVTAVRLDNANQTGGIGVTSYLNGGNLPTSVTVSAA